MDKHGSPIHMSVILAGGIVWVNSLADRTEPVTLVSTWTLASAAATCVPICLSMCMIGYRYQYDLCHHALIALLTI